LDKLETDVNFAGINPRTVYFMHQLQKKNNLKKIINIYYSFMQIYNEKIEDLLVDES